MNRFNQAISLVPDAGDLEAIPAFRDVDKLLKGRSWSIKRLRELHFKLGTHIYSWSVMVNECPSNFAVGDIGYISGKQLDNFNDEARFSCFVKIGNIFHSRGGESYIPEAESLSNPSQDLLSTLSVTYDHAPNGSHHQHDRSFDEYSYPIHPKHK